MFAENHYEQFLEEYESAVSFYYPSKLMKENVGSVFDSAEEKKALVWDYIVDQAMRDQKLEFWECINLELLPWEMVITLTDTVHFGSRFPNESITGQLPTEESTHYRLHHYLFSRNVLRDDEKQRSRFGDCPYNPHVPEAQGMIAENESGGSVIALAVENYTFDLRAHVDMAPVFRRMGGIPFDLERFKPFE